MPKTRDITYASFMCDHRPLKTEPWRVRIVVGGDKLSYSSDTGSPTASLLETKILLNSTISDTHKGARFMCMDSKDFFLATPMPRPESEFMKVPYKYFPQDIKINYRLQELIHNDYIYVKIKKGMYGLKQAAVLAYENLIKNLAPFEYRPIPNIDSYWEHRQYPTKFCLCVNDFGIKFFDTREINHLITALQTNYKISTDFNGKKLLWFYNRLALQRRICRYFHAWICN